MRQRMLLCTGGLILIVALAYGVRTLVFGEAEPTIDELAAAAMNATAHVERERATVTLSQRGSAALPHLRRVAQDGATPEVRAAALYGLGMLGDFDSMEALLLGMEDETPVVRDRAAHAVTRLLARDRRFQVHGPAQDRARIVQFYRTDWDRLRQSPYFESFKEQLGSHETN